MANLEKSKDAKLEGLSYLGGSQLQSQFKPK